MNGINISKLTTIGLVENIQDSVIIIIYNKTVASRQPFLVYGKR